MRGRKIIGRARFTIAAGHTKVVRVKVSRRALRKLAAAGKLRVRASATTSISSGSRAVARRRLLLR